MKLFCTYIKKVLISPTTYISLALVFAITLWGMIGASFSSISAACESLKANGIVSCYNFMMDIGSFRRMTMFAAALPFTSQFCTELKSNSTVLIVVRSSRRNYIVSHVIVCFLTAFATVFIGMMLCIGALDLFFPFFVESFNEYDGAFFSLMNSSNTVPALVLWAVSGLALSAVFPDIFVAFCAPVIMNYLLEFVSFEVDFFPDLLALSLTHTDISDNRAICAVYIISVLTLLTVVFAFIFSKAAGRRIRNEMR